MPRETESSFTGTEIPAGMRNEAWATPVDVNSVYYLLREDRVQQYKSNTYYKRGRVSSLLFLLFQSVDCGMNLSAETLNWPKRSCRKLRRDIARQQQRQEGLVWGPDSDLGRAR